MSGVQVVCSSARTTPMTPSEAAAEPRDFAFQDGSSTRTFRVDSSYLAEGVLIELDRDTNEVATVVTDGSGCFELELGRRLQFATVTAEGFSSLSRLVRVDEHTQEFALTPAVTVQGRLLDGLGRPLPDVRLEFGDRERRMAWAVETDAVGHYRVSLPSTGRFVPRIDQRLWALQWPVLEWPAAELPDQWIATRLPAVRVVHGGIPVESAQVLMMLGESGRPLLAASLQPRHEGTLPLRPNHGQAIELLGKHCQLEVLHPELGSTIVDFDAWPPADWTVELDDGPSNVLHGRVHRQGVGVPAGLRLGATDIDGTWSTNRFQRLGETRCRPSGEFWIPLPRRSRIVLLDTPAGLLGLRTPNDVREAWDVDLSQAASLIVRLGPGLQSPRTELHARHLVTGQLWTESLSRDRWVQPLLAAGDVSIEIVDHRGRTVERDVTLNPGRETDVLFDWNGTEAQPWICHDELNEFPGWEFSASSLDFSRQPVAPDGTLPVDVQNGNEITVHRPDGRAWHFEIPPGPSDEELRLEIETMQDALRGVVLSKENRSGISGARVRVHLPGFAASAICGADGSFSIREIDRSRVRKVSITYQGASWEYRQTEGRTLPEWLKLPLSGGDDEPTHTETVQLFWRGFANPIAGALVFAYRTDLLEDGGTLEHLIDSGQTNRQGRLSLSLPAPATDLTFKVNARVGARRVVRAVRAEEVQQSNEGLQILLRD